MIGSLSVARCHAMMGCRQVTVMMGSPSGARCHAMMGSPSTSYTLYLLVIGS
jgi:hypothetical protein